MTSSASATSWQVRRIVQMVSVKIQLNFFNILTSQQGIIKIRHYLLHNFVESRGRIAEFQMLSKSVITHIGIEQRQSIVNIFVRERKAFSIFVIPNAISELFHGHIDVSNCTSSKLIVFFFLTAPTVGILTLPDNRIEMKLSPSSILTLPDTRIQMKLSPNSILTLPDNRIKSLSFMNLSASNILTLVNNRIQMKLSPSSILTLLDNRIQIKNSRRAAISRS